jgi:transaldolase
MPLETIEAFADHGEVRGQTATEGLDRAGRLWSDLAELGIDEDEVGDRLDREGVEKFTDSYNGAVGAIEDKAKRLGQA